jgi:DNA helicase IV
MAHPDLASEQAHVDRAYERLDEMRARANEVIQAAFGMPRGGTPQARNDRDVIVRTNLHRLEQLEVGDEPLIFGRIDREDDESYHLGRLAISDSDQEPLVVDWRAPVAEPFYRATGRHPMGLTRRRHFLAENRQIVDIEDELFGAGGVEGDGNGLGLGLSGSAALLAALERSRSGRMRDIVATVQREQDEIIRAPLSGVLVVQGGPGTGKTAVALHRAAYLLYTHRFPLERQGVLVVGPNPLFLRYIEHVLPSLGESGVDLSTIGGLVQDSKATGEDTPETSRVKGDPRMGDVLAKAVRDRQRPLPTDIEVPFGAHLLRFTAAASAEVVNAVKRRPGGHNARRRQVETLVFRRLLADHEQQEERDRRVGLRPSEPGDLIDDEGEDLSPPAEALTAETLGRAVRREPVLAEALDRMWPVLTPQQLLHDLFGAKPLIDLAASRWLSPEERAALYRPRSPSVEGVAWTEGDLPLIDEARAILGVPRRRTASGEADDAFRSYGHIVVDEAQDLSPMQLRMLARRSLSGSMTIVGDVAQATGHFASTSWEPVLTHLPTRRGTKTVELTVNYRTPAEIMEVAGRVLKAAAPGLVPPESVRSTDEPPVFRADGNVVAAVDDLVAELDDGHVAVICPRSMVNELRERLSAASVRFGEPNRTGLDAQVTLVPVELVKGLEFDGVVVVEPARLVRETGHGMHALYVAMTRATRRLTVVHSEPLPLPLLPPSNGGPAGH